MPHCPVWHNRLGWASCAQMTDNRSLSRRYPWLAPSLLRESWGGSPGPPRSYSKSLYRCPAPAYSGAKSRKSCETFLM
jgi:hypothetical protein